MNIAAPGYDDDGEVSIPTRSTPEGDAPIVALSSEDQATLIRIDANLTILIGLISNGGLNVRVLNDGVL